MVTKERDLSSDDVSIKVRTSGVRDGDGDGDIEIRRRWANKEINRRPFWDMRNRYDFSERPTHDIRSPQLVFFVFKIVEKHENQEFLDKRSKVDG